MHSCGAYVNPNLRENITLTSTINCGNVGGLIDSFFLFLFSSATRGVLPAVTGNGAYMIIPVVPPQRTNLDRMRIAFQTYAKDGPIARFMSQNGQFYEIYMVSFWGIISMDFNLQIRAGILAMGCCRASQKAKLSLYVGIGALWFSTKTPL